MTSTSAGRHRVRRTAVLLAGLLTALLPGSLVAQPAKRIRSTVECPACRIQFDHLVDLGTDTGPGMIENENSWVVRDARGRFYVVHAYATSIKVYDSNGTFLRLIGRKGGGPGEFEGIAGVYVTEGDTIRVLDYTLSRQSVFSPDHSFVRSTQLAMAPQMHSVVLNDGQTIVNINSRSPGLIGFPLHALGSNGRILASFGSETGIFRPDIPGLTRRVLATHTQNEIWVAHERSYQIERWNLPGGKMVARFERDVSWFPNGEVPRSRPWNGIVDPPDPTLIRIRESADGLLWVQASVADRRWKSVVTPTTPGHFGVTDFDRYVDHIIEIIDWRNERVVASLRFDNNPGYPIADGIFAGLVTERDDRVTIPIYKATLIDTRRK